MQALVANGWTERTTQVRDAETDAEVCAWTVPLTTAEKLGVYAAVSTEATPLYPLALPQVKVVLPSQQATPLRVALLAVQPPARNTSVADAARTAETSTLICVQLALETAHTCPPDARLSPPFFSRASLAARDAPTQPALSPRGAHGERPRRTNRRQ